MDSLISCLMPQFILGMVNDAGFWTCVFCGCSRSSVRNDSYSNCFCSWQTTKHLEFLDQLVSGIVGLSVVRVDERFNIQMVAYEVGVSLEPL
jgi:hypothetical protein